MPERDKFRIAVLTVSDRCSSGETEDVSGTLLKEMAGSLGEVVFHAVCPDEKDKIRENMLKFCDVEKVDLLLSTGGTGFASRDVTPEATLKLIEKKTPGLDEMMRAISLKKTKFASLSRGVSGIRGDSLIINLPGNPKAVKENMEVLLSVIPHGLRLIKGLESSH